jgi:hypothetical protein
MTATDSAAATRPAGPPDMVAGRRVRTNRAPSPWLRERLEELLEGWETGGADTCEHVLPNPAGTALAALALPHVLACPDCLDVAGLERTLECDRCALAGPVRGTVFDVELEDVWVTILVLLCRKCSATEVHR